MDSAYFQTLLDGPFRRQESYELEIPFPCQTELVIQLLALLDDPTASLEKINPGLAELQALEYFLCLDKYVLRYELATENHFLLWEGETAIRTQLQVKMDQWVHCSLTETEAQILFCYQLYETYLSCLLCCKGATGLVVAGIERMYPLADFPQWHSTIDPELYAKIVPYLPAPLDAIVPLSPAQARKVYAWLDEEIGFKPSQLTGFSSRWMIAGSFLTSMVDPEKRIQFGDIDFWVSGSQPGPLIKAMLEMFNPITTEVSSQNTMIEPERGYGNYFLSVTARSGRTINLSINPADTFIREDLLKYFDLDACKFVLDQTGLWGTVRSLEAVQTKTCRLPFYFDRSFEKRNTHLRPPYDQLDIYLNLRSYLLLTNQRLPIRIVKYQAKGFTFLSDEMPDYYENVNMKSILEYYLPDGNWIVNTYLLGGSTRWAGTAQIKYSSRQGNRTIRNFAEGFPFLPEKIDHIYQTMRVWPDWPSPSETDTPAQIALFSQQVEEEAKEERKTLDEWESEIDLIKRQDAI